MDNNVITFVPFYGDKLLTIKIHDTVFVAMRPIVEIIGLAWSSQTVKLKRYREKFNCCDIETVSADGKKRTMLCIPLRKLNGWLFGINPEKVKPEIRENVIKYQDECFEVLHDYWVHNITLQKNTALKSSYQSLASGLTIEQQNTIQAFHHQLVQCMPQAKQASMSLLLWNSVKGKYGVGYKEVPATEFKSIIALMSNVAIKENCLYGEVLDAEQSRSDQVLVSRNNLSTLIQSMDWCYHWFFRIKDEIDEHQHYLIGRIIDHIKDGRMVAHLLNQNIGSRILPDNMEDFPWEGNYLERHEWLKNTQYSLLYN
ncbi:phage antirepressor N-terminal domain-containing protein [Neisseriaceae bacterium ESL0693]|nr:phage antirepressor N-terminal domain-containing protein [Neisseriaceae bacterium ESL0693]